MIEYIEGNLFNSPAKVIVNAVNTVGVMGKGIALEFKKRYPSMFEKYKRACENHSLTIGKLMLVTEIDHMILLFPTKESWRKPSKLIYIEKGLINFCNNYAERNITSIAFPKLGCGNGELVWQDVKILMEKYLKSLPINVYIYLGNNVESEIEPEHKHPKEMQDWFRKNAKDMSFNGIMDDIINVCSILPYDIKYNNEIVSVSYFNKELLFKYQEQNISLNDEELFTYWDDIRNRSIFIQDNDNIKFTLFCYLLYTLGYLSKIKKQIKNEEMVDGFQLNEGLGRAYALSMV